MFQDVQDSVLAEMGRKAGLVSPIVKSLVAIALLISIPIIMAAQLLVDVLSRVVTEQRDVPYRQTAIALALRFTAIHKVLSFWPVSFLGSKINYLLASCFFRLMALF